MAANIAMDLGTSYIRVYMEDKGIVISEPSDMTINKATGEVLAIGKDAVQMRGRTVGDVVVDSPFKSGTITGYSASEYAITNYIKKIATGKVFLPNVLVAVPFDVTEVERHAISTIVEKTGIRKVDFIPQGVVGALGIGIDVRSPVASMVVNIGSSSTLVAVIAGNAIVLNRRINIGGKTFDEAMVRYVRKKFELEIGEQSAENIKMQIGCAFPKEKIEREYIKGRNIYSNLPAQALMSSDDTVEAYVGTMLEFTSEIQSILEEVPPEILNDIAKEGVHFIGGGSSLYGMDLFIHKKINLHINLYEEPENAVIRGSGEAIDLVENSQRSLRAGILAVK